MSFTDFLSNVLAPVAPQSEEEARRRREEEEKAQEKIDAESSKPVTQTLKIDPKTGEQTLTVSGSPQDLSADNPLTPTVAQPGMPIAPVAPQQFNNEPPEVAQLPQPGPATQVAGPVPPSALQQPPGGPVQVRPTTPPAPVAGPIDPNAPQTQAALNDLTVGPNAPVTAPPAKPQTPEEKYAEVFQTGQGNKEAMARIYQDPEAPEYIKRAAAEQLKTQFIQDQERKKAEQQINSAITNGNGSDFARLLQQQKGEGSYVKAYLYQRLGLTELAKAEQEKLGAENKWMPAMGLNGERAMVQYGAGGQPLTGYDNTGRQLTGDELAAFAVNSSVAKGAVTGQTFGKAPIDGENHTISHTVLPNGAGVIWKDETTGKTLPNAPAGYAPVGQQNPVTQAAIRVASQTEAKMRKANADAAALHATPPFSEDAILLEKERILNGTGSTLGAGGEPIVAPTKDKAAASVNAGQGLNAVQIANQLGVPIISGVRDTAKQQTLWDESVRAGRTGFTAQGNPIAKPGTSAHENAMAVDIDSAKLTPGQRQALESNGLRQLPNDPNHWELKGNRPAPVAATAPVSPQSEMARKIANYELPPPSISQRNSAGGAALMNDVLKLNPNYDGQKYKENSKIISDFTPSGQAGKSVVAMGTAASHIGDLRPLITALNQGDAQATNLMLNNIKKWTGDTNVTNLEAVGPAVAAEIQKTFVSGGGGTGAERDELAKAFGSARSKEQLEGAVKMYENLMVGKLGELEKQYARTGRKDFWTNIVSDERLKDVYDRHQAERAVRENKPVAGQTKTGIKFKVVTE